MQSFKDLLPLVLKEIDKAAEWACNPLRTIEAWEATVGKCEDPWCTCETCESYWDRQVRG